MGKMNENILKLVEEENIMHPSVSNTIIVFSPYLEYDNYLDALDLFTRIT